MTVEFVVAFPAMLAIALVAMNALLFFSECASFDRLARQSICVHAAAPAYGKGGFVRQGMAPSGSRGFRCVFGARQIHGDFGVHADPVREELFGECFRSAHIPIGASSKHGCRSI